MCYVPTAHNLSDPFTKPLESVKCLQLYKPSVAIANLVNVNVNYENIEELLDNKDNWTTPYGPCTLLK